MFDIMNYLSEGHDNGRTDREISELCGADRRSVREHISRARRTNIILNMQDGYGYFIPQKGEESLIDLWLMQEESRLKKHAIALRAARKNRRDRNA